MDYFLEIFLSAGTVVESVRAIGGSFFFYPGLLESNFRSSFFTDGSRFIVEVFSGGLLSFLTIGCYASTFTAL